MIEILRVLADGTATSPRRSAVAPVARSLRYQLTWNSALSHSSSRRFTRSRMAGSFRQARTIPRLDWHARPRDSTRDGGHAAHPRHDDRHRGRARLDPPRRRDRRERRPHRGARPELRAGGALPGRRARLRPRARGVSGLREHAHAPLAGPGPRDLRGPLALAYAAVHGRPGPVAAAGVEPGRRARDGPAR